MKIENRRDMSLTMDRNVRQAKRETRSYAKHYKGTASSLSDTLNNEAMSNIENTLNSYNKVLKKNAYNTVKEMSKKLCEKAEELKKNKGDQKEAAKGVSQFIDLYNSLLGQMDRLDTNTMDRYAKEMQEKVLKYQEEFQKMGIEQDKNGMLSVDSAKLADAELKSWYEFLDEASEVVKKVQKDAENQLLALNRGQTIYGTNYNRYGQEKI